MNTHVFVVDKTTFKLHLEYMFAGTGAGNKKVPFLTGIEEPIHWATENNLVGMIADISRLRIGDKIIFYLQAYDDKPGMFYGVFKVASLAFFDENDGSNYLVENLKKPLTFRVKIEPDHIYPKGVTEHDYLDSLIGVEHPYQMCWSLIYRKLKANRGCTMITDYEYDSLLNKLECVNNNICLDKNINNVTFNDKTSTIEVSNASNEYKGRTDILDIKDRMLHKASNRNAFEVHLQAYIMQNFDNDVLRKLLLRFDEQSCWIGNEVSCGVGMQSIDIMLIQEKQDNVYIKVIELKCVEPYMYILEKQLPWYINWVTDYVVPNYILKGKKVHIIPCVIAAGTSKLDFIEAGKSFNGLYDKTTNIVIEPLEYIQFVIDKKDIEFQKVI